MANIFEFIADNPNQTKKIASSLARYLKPSFVITLDGELGAGKTVFTQGLAEGLEIKEVVNSPTFTIIKEYAGKLPLYHMDVYRLADGIDDLGFEEYFFGDGITVIEWASIIRDYLPEEYLNVKIIKLDEFSRKIILEPLGERYLRLCEELISDENTSN